MIDAHCHLPDPGREAEMIDGLRRGGVDLACVNGTHPGDWNRVIELVEMGEGLIAGAVGLHPWFVHTVGQTWVDALRALLTLHPDLGVGECGLDRARPGLAPIEIQEGAFSTQIDLAVEFDRPLAVHSVRATARTLLALRTATPRRFLLHAYGGSAETVADFAALGASFSFTLWHADGDRWRRAVRAVPAGRIFAETDTSRVGSGPPAFDRRAYPTHAPRRRDAAGLSRLLGQKPRRLLRRRDEAGIAATGQPVTDPCDDGVGSVAEWVWDEPRQGEPAPWRRQAGGNRKRCIASQQGASTIDHDDRVRLGGNSVLREKAGAGR